MKVITLNCKIITYLFMSGVEQQAEPRIQSFKGLFRYWFRILGGNFEDEKKFFGWGQKGLIREKSDFLLI